MTTEWTARLRFSVTQIIAGLTALLLYTRTLEFSYYTASLGAISYLLIFPFVCFLLLSGLALFQNRDHFLVTRSGLWGAAIAGYSVYLLPVLLLGIDIATYSGGGANIGLGLLVLVAPMALPIFMFIGLRAGESRAKRLTLRSSGTPQKRGAP